MLLVIRVCKILLLKCTFKMWKRELFVFGCNLIAFDKISVKAFDKNFPKIITSQMSKVFNIWFHSTIIKVILKFVRNVEREEKFEKCIDVH